MALKINLKDLAAVTSAEGTDKMVICYGADGAPKLLPLSAVSGTGLASGASGILLTCASNGYTYRVSVRLVDGEPSFDLAKVSDQGQFASLLCESNSTTYQLKIILVNNRPTLSMEAL